MSGKFAIIKNISSTGNLSSQAERRQHMETYDPKFEEMKKEARKRAEKFKQTMKNRSFAVHMIL